MLDKFKNWRNKIGLWFWVGLAVLLFLGWRLIAQAGNSTKVEAAKVTRGDLVESISTSGTVKADQYAQLTFPTGGKIQYVNVKSGDKVRKGQAIAGIDTTVLNSIYQQAINNYRKYQATAENVLDQVKGHSSDETLTQKDTRTSAEVNRDNAYDSVLAAQDNLKNANIYAPFNGIMDTVSPSSPGINVVAATANYTIVNPDTVYFDAEVEETDLPSISVGQRVDIKLDAYPDENIQGKLESIGMVAFMSSTGGNAYHVRISLPENENQKFRIGMGGDVDIIYNTISNTLMLPTSAVTSADTDFVWVIQNGRAKKVNVEIGKSSVNETEIKSGLTEGTIIISQPPTGIKDGQKVSI